MEKDNITITVAETTEDTILKHRGIWKNTYVTTYSNPFSITPPGITYEDTILKRIVDRFIIVPIATILLAIEARLIKYDMWKFSRHEKKWHGPIATYPSSSLVTELKASGVKLIYRKYSFSTKYIAWCKTEADAVQIKLLFGDEILKVAWTDKTWSELGYFGEGERIT